MEAVSQKGKEKKRQIEANREHYLKQTHRAISS